jgi:SNF2 family DNA or RNA helicase
MLSLRVEAQAGKLRVFAPFEFAEALKALPARRWNKVDKCNEYPATVGAARNIRDLVHSINGGTQQTALRATGDKAFHKLLQFVRAQDDAQAIKTHKCTDTCPQWHHQTVALSFATPQPAVVLTMKMGTGKTKVALDLIASRGHRLVLVLTRKKAIKVWPKQAAQFQPSLRVVRFDAGSTAAKVNQLENLVACARVDHIPTVIVMNYEAAWREGMADALLAAGLDLVVLDESHKIKAPGGKASKFCQQLRQRVPCCAALTGTFMGDKPIDIYGQMRAIDTGVFGTSFTKFKERYVIMGGYLNKEILGYQNQDEMMAKVGRYMYEVDESVLRLQPARHVTYYCQLPADVRRVYDRFEAEAFAALVEQSKTEPGMKDIVGTITADNVLVKLLRLQQITGGFVTTDEIDETYTGKDVRYIVKRVDSAKAELLQSVLADLPDAEGLPEHAPVVVYCKFKEDLAAIKEVAGNLGYVYGEISGRADDQEAFTSGKVNLLGCQIQAGGTGVDGLQEISHIAVYYSTGYSLTDYEQSLKRLDRPGQKFSVLNIHLLAEDTVDETIMQALDSKQNIIDAMMARARQVMPVDGSPACFDMSATL